MVVLCCITVRPELIRVADTVAGGLKGFSFAMCFVCEAVIYTVSAT